MNDILIAILIGCLLVLFYQDWKHRRIHVILPILIFFVSFLSIPLEHMIVLKMILYNFIFFMLTFGLLILYMSIKSKKYSNPFQNYFGLGDLLFYVSITPLFVVQNYILFFIFSMLFAIAVQLSLKKIISKNTIPLAGYTSIFLALLILKDLTMPFSKITLL